MKFLSGFFPLTAKSKLICFKHVYSKKKMPTLKSFTLILTGYTAAIAFILQFAFSAFENLLKSMVFMNWN